MWGLETTRAFFCLFGLAHLFASKAATNKSIFLTLRDLLGLIMMKKYATNDSLNEVGSHGALSSCVKVQMKIQNESVADL